MLYLRQDILRLAHLIATFFNRCACGPPKPFTAPSTWTWIDHPVSGLRPLTIALLRLGLPAGVPLLGLPLASERNSPDRSTKSTRSRLSHIALPPVADTGFQVLFHPRLPTRFPVSRGTPDPACPLPFSCTGLSPSPAGSPKTVPLTSDSFLQSITPACTHAGLGSSAFARRYLRNRCFFLFLWVLRCFSSPGSPRMAMDSPCGA